MFLLKEPSEAAIEKFLSSSRSLPFSYPEVGATQREPPAGYIIDHNRIRLGNGKEVFDRAAAALREWKQFDLGWIRIAPASSPLEVGVVVAILASHFGFWSLNPCRVVYLIDEDDAGQVQKFGFAYGTLSNHVERGEERFLIEWLRHDDSVWYDILAFSRPNQFLVRMGVTYARMLQKRFARDSMAAMRSIIEV